jgi:FixJ family two-component response regulator
MEPVVRGSHDGDQCNDTIVDDDHFVRESLRDLLESLGYAISTFESTERFLQSGRLL